MFSWIMNRAIIAQLELFLSAFLNFILFMLSECSELRKLSKFDLFGSSSFTKT